MAVVEHHVEQVGDPRVVIHLVDVDAIDIDDAGAKATNLALAMQNGFPTVDGFVVPVSAVTHLRRSSELDCLRPAWHDLSDEGASPVVVRSSSPAEDTNSSSMAGQFTSVVDVRGWTAFVRAFHEVVASAGGAAMAVLVQRHIEPAMGGVLFGVDPVSGRADRRVIAAVTGGPWQLVSGEVEGRRTEVTPGGRVVTADGDPAPVLDRHDRRRLLQLEARAARLFGGAQDIEWAIDDRGQVWLLQSRPITAIAKQGLGPRLGPGPVAETFPEPLSVLEQDLWIPPLRSAIVETLELTGAANRRRTRQSPVLVSVDGRMAVDLDLVEGPPRRRLAGLDPRPGFRRLRAAWRVGRLQETFHSLASDLLGSVDDELAAVPPVRELEDEALLRLLENSRQFLLAVHSHEMLAAQFEREVGGSAAAHAMVAVAQGRDRGWSDREIVARTPVALALVPPTLGQPMALPEVGAAGDMTLTPMSQREMLRLRARWIHELTGLVARELGQRLADRGVLNDAADVDTLTCDGLAAGLNYEQLVLDASRRPQASPPLPAVFRLAVDGSVVAEEPSAAGRAGHGVGAGGGRAQGTVTHHHPNPNDVLVVRTLDPSLAAALSGLAAIVAETGSPLSHLAILAREQGVPTVVGYPGARAAFPVGSTVVVDGHTGEVQMLDVQPQAAQA